MGYCELKLTSNDHSDTKQAHNRGAASAVIDV